MSQCAGSKLNLLVDVADAALFKMSMTMVDIKNDINMPQVIFILASLIPGKGISVS